jgi:putative pyruvate formate lyase activating enzyme
MNEFKEYDNCRLCPRDCGINRNRGEKGYCRETSVLTAARAALHYWEEPCISGVHGSGAVFFSGCNMGCVFCQNYEIAHGQVQKAISGEKLAEIFLRLQDQKAANINLVTPTHYVPTIVYAIDRALQQGLKIPVVYNTGSYEKADTLRMLDGLVDIYLPDCKYYNGELAARYSSAPDYFTCAVQAIEEMVRQTGKPVFFEPGVHPGISGVDECSRDIDADRYNDLCEAEEETPICSSDSKAKIDINRSHNNSTGVAGEQNIFSDPAETSADQPDDYSAPLMKRGTIVRHLILPGHLDDSREVITRLHDRFGDNIFLSLMNQYTPMPHGSVYPELSRHVDRTDYEALVDHAIDIGVEYAFIQGEETDKDSFIPAFDYTGIE